MIASILLLGVVWDLLKGLKMVTLMEGGSCKSQPVKCLLGNGTATFSPSRF